VGAGQLSAAAFIRSNCSAPWLAPSDAVKGGAGMKARTALIALTISIGQFSPFHLTDTLAQTRTGVASVYSTESGSKTASGQKLTPAALTAAHRSLPLGSKVTVTQQEQWTFCRGDDQRPRSVRARPRHRHIACGGAGSRVLRVDPCQPADR